METIVVISKNLHYILSETDANGDISPGRLTHIIKSTETLPRQTTVISYIAKGNSLRIKALNLDTKVCHFTINPQMVNSYTSPTFHIDINSNHEKELKLLSAGPYSEYIIQQNSADLDDSEICTFIVCNKKEMTNSTQDHNYIHHELAWIQTQIINKSREGAMTQNKIARHEHVSDDQTYLESYGGQRMNEQERQYRIADEKNSEEIKYLEDMYSSLFITLCLNGTAELKNDYVNTELNHIKQQMYRLNKTSQRTHGDFENDMNFRDGHLTDIDKMNKYSSRCSLFHEECRQQMNLLKKREAYVEKYLLFSAP